MKNWHQLVGRGFPAAQRLGIHLQDMNPADKTWHGIRRRKERRRQLRNLALVFVGGGATVLALMWIANGLVRWGCR